MTQPTFKTCQKCGEKLPSTARMCWKCDLNAAPPLPAPSVFSPPAFAPPAARPQLMTTTLWLVCAFCVVNILNILGGWYGQATAAQKVQQIQEQMQRRSEQYQNGSGYPTAP